MEHTLSSHNVIHDGPTTRSDIPSRNTTGDQRLSEEFLELCFEYRRFGVCGLLFMFRRNGLQIVVVVTVVNEMEVRIGIEMIVQVTKKGEDTNLNPISESISSSIASAASRSQFFSWFSFLTLCWAESISRASCMRALSLSRRYSSTNVSGISSSSIKK